MLTIYYPLGVLENHAYKNCDICTDCYHISSGSITTSSSFASNFCCDSYPAEDLDCACLILYLTYCMKNLVHCRAIENNIPHPLGLC